MLAVGVETTTINYNAVITACFGAQWSSEVLQLVFVPRAEHRLSMTLKAVVGAGAIECIATIKACAVACYIVGAERWVSMILRAVAIAGTLSHIAVLQACADASNAVTADHWLRMLFVGR